MHNVYLVLQLIEIFAKILSLNFPVMVPVT